MMMIHNVYTRQWQTHITFGNIFFVFFSSLDCILEIQAQPYTDDHNDAEFQRTVNISAHKFSYHIPDVRRKFKFIPFFEVWIHVSNIVFFQFSTSIVSMHDTHTHSIYTFSEKINENKTTDLNEWYTKMCQPLWSLGAGNVNHPYSRHHITDLLSLIALYAPQRSNLLVAFSHSVFTHSSQC